jgi:hypothetical protein
MLTGLWHSLVLFFGPYFALAPGNSPFENGWVSGPSCVIITLDSETTVCEFINPPRTNVYHDEKPLLYSNERGCSSFRFMNCRETYYIRNYSALGPTTISILMYLSMNFRE